MGTRHLIGVVVDGDFKIAQYGQWDGYPSGQGTDILGFLKSANLDRFAEKVRKLEWVTDEEIESILSEIGSSNGWMTMEQADEFKRLAPGLTRDAGADILRLVADGTVTKVQDSRDFAKDSLFCEWAYVIDLDNQTLEVYSGFQEDAPKSGRWAGMREERDGVAEKYAAVDLIRVWDINDLPTPEDFVNTLDPEPEDTAIEEEN